MPTDDMPGFEEWFHENHGHHSNPRYRELARASWAAATDRATGIADCWCTPPGINITSGVPSEIHVAIGRGRYEGEEAELAADVAEGVSDGIAAAIGGKRSDAPPPPGPEPRRT
ncbi:MAG TPA: hypothetical protein VD866_29955 [Urbifossiella sp.]|nr:hypothetical protein [Urbifossiella sp.]